MDGQGPHEGWACFSDTAATIDPSQFINRAAGPRIDTTFSDLNSSNTMAHPDSSSPLLQMYDRQTELSPASATWRGAASPWVPARLPGPPANQMAQYPTYDGYRSRPASTYTESVAAGPDLGCAPPGAFSITSDDDTQSHYSNQQSTGLESAMQSMEPPQGPPKKKRQTSTTTKSKASSTTSRRRKSAPSVHNEQPSGGIFPCQECGSAFRIQSELTYVYYLHMAQIGWCTD